MNTIIGVSRVPASAMNNMTDPDLEFVTALLRDDKRNMGEIAQETKRRFGCGVTQATLYNWLNGRVARPQNRTLTVTAWVLGYERRWIKVRRSIT